jgi:hypothetical protein
MHEPQVATLTAFGLINNSNKKQLFAFKRNNSYMAENEA